MFLHEFPDIHWLKQQVKERFTSRHNPYVNPGKYGQGWPSVILNAKSTVVERKDIIGTFSLFVNISGNSTINSAGKQLNIGNKSFGLTNLGEAYDLLIHSDHPTETFNIHFGEELFKQTISSIKNTHIFSLDSPFEHQHFNTHVRTLFRDMFFNKALSDLYTYGQKTTEKSTIDQESLVQQLLIAVLKKCHKHHEGLNPITAIKKSTKEEILKRLYLSMDYMHEHFDEAVSLEILSKISCLSKYHYLRTFKEVFGLTPYQFISRIRLEKAKEMLITTKLSIIEIAHHTGFIEANSFSKFFKQAIGTNANAYRKLAILDRDEADEVA